MATTLVPPPVPIKEERREGKNHFIYIKSKAKSTHPLATQFSCGSVCMYGVSV